MIKYYKALIVNNEIKQNRDICLFLECRGIKLIYSPKFRSLPEQTASHPDMQILRLNEKNFLSAYEGFEYYKMQLAEYGINVICAGKLSNKYPDDVKLNAFFYKDKIICYKNYIDKNLLEYLKYNNIKIINTRQGYAKCSCVDMDGSVVTSSKPICNILNANGIESYYLNPENIKLNGYDNGFIGGCCGYIGEKILFFSGDISKYDILIKTAAVNGIKIEHIKNSELYDYGGFIGIN